MGNSYLYYYLRCFLMIFNISLILVGLGVLGSSIFLYMEPEILSVFYSADILYEMRVLLVVLICIGAVTVILAILGCLGTYYEYQCLLGFYSTCIAIIICIEVDIGVLSILYRSEFEDKLIKALEGLIDNWMNRSTDLSSEAQKIVARDFFQSTFECCGAKGREDYLESSLPSSCCPAPVLVCDVTAYPVGCHAKATEAIQTVFRVFTAIILAVASYEIIGLLLLLIFYFVAIRQFPCTSYASVPTG
ncbi:hypothetical protein Aperf_G00000063018 [Anoplocephala perfoliata]